MCVFWTAAMCQPSINQLVFVTRIRRRIANCGCYFLFYGWILGQPKTSNLNASDKEIKIVMFSFPLSILFLPFPCPHFLIFSPFFILYLISFFFSVYNFNIRLTLQTTDDRGWRMSCFQSYETRSVALMEECSLQVFLSKVHS